MGGGRRIVALVLAFAVGMGGGYGIAQAVKDEPERTVTRAATPTPEATPQLPDAEWVLFEDADDAFPIEGAAFTPSVAISAEEGCDKAKLKQFLNDEPGRERAWLAVHGVSADQSDAFIDRLEAAVLLDETPVTDHGYFADLDRSVEINAVLAEGTLVLADPEQDNRPVVRCRSGSPLRPPKCPPNCVAAASPTPSATPRRTFTPRRTTRPVRTATPRPTVKPTAKPSTAPPSTAPPSTAPPATP